MSFQYKQAQGAQSKSIAHSLTGDLSLSASYLFRQKPVKTFHHLR